MKKRFESWVLCFSLLWVAGACGSSSGDDIAAGDSFIIQTWTENCDGADSIIAVIPDEVGHWSMQRIDPTGRPYTLESIDYFLEGGEGMSGVVGSTTLAHGLRVFVQDEPIPAASPSYAFDGQVPDIEGDPLLSRVRSVDISRSGIAVGPDQYVFVAFEMVFEEGQTMAVGTCPEPTGETAFWSFAVDEPYPWPTMGDFGFNVEYRVRINARAL